MMIGVYSIRDSKVSFSGVFHCDTDEAALRAFISSVRSETPNPANMFPEDKSLWRVGWYDTKSGELTPEKTKLAEAVTYVLEQKSVLEELKNEKSSE